MDKSEMVNYIVDALRSIDPDAGLPAVWSAEVDENVICVEMDDGSLFDLEVRAAG